MESSSGKRAGKDTSGDAQGRFVVSLPRELRAYIEGKADKIADIVEEQTGARPQLSPAQVVESLIRADQKRTSASATASA